MFLPIYFQLRRAVDIAVRAENYAAAKMLLDARGGPVSTQCILLPLATSIINTFLIFSFIPQVYT